MVNTATELITHLQAAVTAHKITATIKGYQGELQAEAVLKALAPAVFVTPMASTPFAEVPEHEIDLIVVTQTKQNLFRPKTDSLGDLALADDTTRYLAQNDQFSGNTIDLETMRISVLSVDQKYTIAKISLTIRELA